jgi:four helix bundle protein
MTLDIFQVSKKLVQCCYKETNSFPNEEKFGMISQIRRAALSVYLNIVEACSRKSEKERKRYFEVARGSLVELDAAFELADELNYTNKEKLTELGQFILHCFQMLSKMI